MDPDRGSCRIFRLLTNYRSEDTDLVPRIYIDHPQIRLPTNNTNFLATHVTNLKTESYFRSILQRKIPKACLPKTCRDPFGQRLQRLFMNIRLHNKSRKRYGK